MQNMWDRKAEDERALELANKPKHPFELYQEQWDTLVSERDHLIDAQSVLYSKHGAAASRLSEWSSIESRVADVNRRLTEMKPKVFGAQT